MGVVFEFPLHGLIHHERPEPNLQLVGRAQATGSSRQHFESTTCRVDNIDDQKRRVYRPHMMMNAQESLLRRRAKAPARA